MGTSSLTCNKTTGQQFAMMGTSTSLHLTRLSSMTTQENSERNWQTPTWTLSYHPGRTHWRQHDCLVQKKRVCRNQLPIEHPLFNQHSSWVWTLFDEVLQSNTFFGAEAQQFKRILASSQWYLFRAGPRTRLLFDDWGTLCWFSSWLYVVKFLDCYVI